MLNTTLIRLYVKASLFLDRLKEDQRGVTAIEYALVAVAIASVVGVAFSGESGSLKSALKAAMEKVSTAISTE